MKVQQVYLLQQSQSLGETHPVPAQALPAYKSCKSFAPNLMSLFGSTTNCVINVNFGQLSTSVKFQSKEDFHYEMPEEMDKALSNMDLNF